MADLKTNFTNRAESTLSSALATGATTINVTDTSSFPAVPFRCVIDPGNDAKAEEVLVDSGKTSTTFTLTSSSSRGQSGTSDTSHDQGAIIAFVPTAGWYIDLHDRIDANDTAIAANETAIDNATYPVIIGAGAMGPVQNSPTLAATSDGRHPKWLLDASTNEAVGGIIWIPSTWTTFHVDAYWTNVGAGSGDIVANVVLATVYDTDDLTLGDVSSGDLTITAPAQDIVKVTRFHTGHTRGSEGLYHARMQRKAADAADSLANDMGLLAIVLTKAS